MDAHAFTFHQHPTVARHNGSTALHVSGRILDVLLLRPKRLATSFKQYVCCMEGGNIIVRVLKRKNRKNIVLGLGAKEDGPLLPRLYWDLEHACTSWFCCVQALYFG